MPADKPDKPFEVPMVAICYDCGKTTDLYHQNIGVLKKCPHCGSKNVDSWGVEVLPMKDKPDAR